MSGDYINRETLRKLMYTEAFDRDTGLQRWDSGLWIRFKLFKNCLDTIPAADVVEVVHASWVWNPDGMDWGIGAWVCGKCKSRPETWWNTVKESHPLRCSGSRYCGNCGAKMDGGQDE